MSRYSDCYFESSASHDGLGSKTVRGGLITLVGQAVRFFVQLGSTMVLARLLVPDDFGLFGMVLIVVNFLNLFKDIGLSQALIQRPEITREEASNLFWVNVLVSAGLSLGVACVAPLISIFYAREELIVMTWALSIGMFLSGLGLQHRALMMRNMQFGALALIEIVVMLAGAVIALLLAWFDYGYWALVAQSIVVSVISVFGFWFFCRWLPSLWSSRVSIRPYLKYGGNLAGFNLLNFFSRNADNIMIGYYWGAGPLGFYTRAYSLLMLPIQQINAPMTKVMLPALSRLQADDNEYRRFYVKAVSLTIAVTFPVVGAFLAATEPVVLLFLGENWLDAVPIFHALVPAAFVSALNVTTGWVFQSRGTTDRQLRWTFGAAPLHVLAMFIGLSWGAVGVAWGVSVSFCVVRIPYWYYTFSGTPLNVRDLIVSVGKALAVVVPSALFTIESVRRFEFSGMVYSLCGSLLIYIVGLACLDLAFFRRNGLCFQLLEFRKYIKNV